MRRRAKARLSTGTYIVPLVAALLLAAPARADLQPVWDPEWCGRKKLGEECVAIQGDPHAGERGTCQKATCTRYDAYDSDPPRAYEVECVRCVSPFEAEAMAAAAVDAEERTRRYALAVSVFVSMSVLGGSWVYRRRKQHA